MINWNKVISELKNGKVVTVDPSQWNMDNPEYAKMLELWRSNNFNTDSVRWVNYYDCKDIQNTVAENLNVTPLRSWISCVEPGYMTGYHYDIDDYESEYLKHGKLKRYSIFISEPNLGHIFILGQKYYYQQSQGKILEWDNHREWHNGIKGGLTNKYMFNLLGY